MPKTNLVLRRAGNVRQKGGVRTLSAVHAHGVRDYARCQAGGLAVGNLLGERIALLERLPPLRLRFGDRPQVVDRAAAQRLQCSQ